MERDELVVLMGTKKILIVLSVIKAANNITVVLEGDLLYYMQYAYVSRFSLWNGDQNCLYQLN